MGVVKIRVSRKELEECLNLPVNVRVDGSHSDKLDPNNIWVYLESPIFPDKMDRQPTPVWARHFEMDQKDGSYGEVCTLRPE